MNDESIFVSEKHGTTIQKIVPCVLPPGYSRLLKMIIYPHARS